MHVHTIFFVASIVTPIIAAPVSLNTVATRENSIIERRNDFSVSRLLSAVFKREVLIEARPVDASYDAISVAKRTVEDEDESSNEEEDESLIEDDDSDLDESVQKRGKFKPGGGSKEKRGKFKPGGGSKEKRGKFKPGGGSKEKRGKFKPGGGPKER